MNIKEMCRHRLNIRMSNKPTEFTTSRLASYNIGVAVVKIYQATGWLAC